MTSEIASPAPPLSASTAQNAAQNATQHVAENATENAPDPAVQASPAATAVAPAPAFTASDGRGILISEPAMRQLAALMAQQGAGKVLRVGVRSGGCSGMSYTMDFIDADQIRGDDEQYTYEPPDGGAPFRVVSDPKSLLYIYGMQLDFSSALIGGGFNFSNPNASQTCGCGSSFAV